MENSGNLRPAIRTQSWDDKVRNGHMLDVSALPLKENLDIAVKLLWRFKQCKISPDDYI